MDGKLKGNIRSKVEGRLLDQSSRALAEEVWGNHLSPREWQEVMEGDLISRVENFY